MKKFAFSLLLITPLILVSCARNIIPFIKTNTLYFPPLQGSQWEQVSPEELGWNTDKIPELKKILQENGTRAFIVLKNGKIVIEEYFNKDLSGEPFTQNSSWYWASAGKTLTAILVGKAQEEKFLNINQKTSDFLGLGWTNLTADQESQITIRHQLTMTSGLDESINNPDCATPNCLVFKASAGTRWAYHNAPYTLLSKVIENATKQNHNDYFESRISERIGMDGSWVEKEFYYSYHSTARAMARFGILMLAKGKWKNRIILKDMNYFQEMLSPSQKFNQSYGYFWWLNGKNSYMTPKSQSVFNNSICTYAPADMYAAIGRDGQIFDIVPSQNLIVIRMGTADIKTSSFIPFEIQNQIWEKLSEIIK